jgi:hypothetical protein
MTCRSCGATIADKAIVCYRCGTPTAVPQPPARPKPPARAPWAIVVATLAMAGVTVALAVASPEHRTAAEAVGGALTVALGAWAAARWLGR